MHHLLYVPGLDAAVRLTDRLGRDGNLAEDGRPTLAMDASDLLQATLDSGDGAYLVPAHLWTPWVGVLSATAGFDSIEDCYGELADHIFAVETGLSADPPMNWRVSRLDRFQSVSFSDAHAPSRLGPGGDRARPPSWTTSPSAGRWRPGWASWARWSCSPRRPLLPERAQGLRRPPGAGRGPRPGCAAPSAASG